MKKILIAMISMFFISTAVNADIKINNIAVTEEANKTTTETSKTTFSNKERGYTFEYPSDWTQKDGLKDFDIFIMAPKNDEGRSLANISIISGELPKDMDLEKYTSENIKNLEKEDSTIKIDERGDTTVGGVPAKWIRYNKEEIDVVHYFFKDKKGIGYLITCGSAKDAYDQYKGICKEVVESFTFTNGSNGTNNSK